MELDEATLASWRARRGKPNVRSWPKVIQFLGYDPRPAPDSIGQTLVWWREGRGISQKELAVIEAEISGAPAPEAGPGARGFVGVAFRVQPDLKTYDAFYLRPTNGRADDQVRRNRSAQYMSHPGWPWMRLREESPGRYESYVDLVPGAWTPIRIEVQGDRARFYVHGQSQPTLVVDDVKTGVSGHGGIALWIDNGTIAYFRNLRVTAAPQPSPSISGALEVAPEVLDRYVGVYSRPGAPAKPTISRRGTTLYFQPPGESAVSLEATADNKFEFGPAVFFEFDAEKGQMIIRRPNGELVFTKEK